MRANINRGARRFIGKADDEVLRRVARGRQSFASRELVDEIERAGLRRTVAFTRDALAIARPRCRVGKKRRRQRAKGCAVHISPGRPLFPAAQLRHARAQTPSHFRLAAVSLSVC
jgi:hypothetical protein